MFDFLDMMGSYEQRKVKNTKIKDGEVDTCAVTDSTKPFETGIKHVRYNGGAWIIVELYDTKEEAIKGHDKWVDTMEANQLPEQLNDVSTCAIAQLLHMVNPPSAQKKKEK